MERCVGQRSHLACDADHVEATRHIRRQVELQHGIAQVVAQRHADRRVVGQEQIALVFLAQPQLAFRADHAGRLHTADLGGFELLLRARPLVAVGVHQHGAGAGKGHLHHRQRSAVAVFVHVGRACNHALRGGGAIVDVHQHQPVGVRMGKDAHHLPHHEEFRVPPVADAVDGVHGQPGQRHALGQLLDRHGNVDVFFKPR